VLVFGDGDTEISVYVMGDRSRDSRPNPVLTEHYVVICSASVRRSGTQVVSTNELGTK
jgi:hypothetical protein